MHTHTHSHTHTHTHTCTYKTVTGDGLLVSAGLSGNKTHITADKEVKSSVITTH